MISYMLIKIYNNYPKPQGMLLLCYKLMYGQTNEQLNTVIFVVYFIQESDPIL